MNLRPVRLGVGAPRRFPRPYPRAGSRPWLGPSRRPTRAEGTSGGGGASGSPAWIGSRVSPWVLVEEEAVVVVIVIGVLFVLGMVLVPFGGRQPTATPRARRTARDASAPGRRRARARPRDERTSPSPSRRCRTRPGTPVPSEVEPPRRERRARSRGRPLSGRHRCFARSRRRPCSEQMHPRSRNDAEFGGSDDPGEMPSSEGCRFSRASLAASPRPIPP